jgi:hypothetical protein
VLQAVTFLKEFEMAEQGFVRRKCDYCEESQEFPSQTAQFTPEGEAQLKSWITLVRIFPVRGQLQPVQMHACKDSCAANILSLGMLDLPKEVKDMLAEDERRNADLQKGLNEKFGGLSIAELGAEPANPAEFPTPAGEA